MLGLRNPVVHSLVLCSIALLAGCGDDDDTVGHRDASGSDEDSGQAGHDGGAAGMDGGIDGSTGGHHDASTPPGAFSIRGLTGPGDDVADDWLMSAGVPTLDWTASEGAQRYDATLYEADGTTVACPTVELVEDTVSVTFDGCMLDEGHTYRASVIARAAGGARTPADNDGFRFAVSALAFGQPDTASSGAALGLALPNDAALVGTKLLVADQNNSRVLIWNAIPTASHAAPDLVLGQPDFTTTPADYGGVGASGFKGSNSVASDGTRLIVGDRFNHRVMIWNTFPTENNEPADVVLGQPDFQTIDENSGGIGASSLTEPQAWLGGGKLFVSDRNNARVLIWNTVPGVSHAPADVVLGQPDMVSKVVNNGGLSASSIADPGHGWVDGTRLFLPDIANHRVLIWNTIPTSNNVPADLVLGQPNMTTNTQGTGSLVSATTMSQPISVYASGTFIAVADYGNHRVLLWTSAIAANGQAADLVLGQPDATSSMVNAGGKVSAASMANPNSVVGDATHLVVCDRFNHRVLIYSPIPSATGAAADVAVGQPDLTSGRLNNPGAVSASTFAGPVGVTLLGDGFALADSDNARVLIWDAPPTAPDDAPSLVLGQPDFSSFGQFGGSTTAQSLCSPWHLSGDAARLAIGEQCARRISVWSSLPTATQQAADLAVGQPDLMMSVNNNGGVTASSLSGRPQPQLAGDRLIVADPNNHRVLIWNAVPTASGVAADVVVGQPDMTSAIVNNGGLSAQSLAVPLFATTSGDKLLVADSDNHRVLIWNAMPTADHAAADVVLGQPNMTSGALTAPTARSIGNPYSLHVDADGRLYVVDIANHRVLYWNAIPTENYTAADGVIGQPDMTSGLANNGGLSGRSLQAPSAVLAVENRLYITDTGNNRMLLLPRP